MEEAITTLSDRDMSINRTSIELGRSQMLDDSSRPLLDKGLAHSGITPKSIVSTWGSTISKRAQAITGTGDDDEDEEDVCDGLIRNIRQRTQEATIRLPSSKKVDVEYHRRAKRLVRRRSSSGEAKQRKNVHKSVNSPSS